MGLLSGANARLWARSGANITIPGIHTVAQARKNAAAMVFGPLGVVQMEEIERLLRR